MESQKDRFIRQFMLIEDDRKERGFDQRSVERKQRVMPQGQIDLGIYPGGEAPEEFPFGFRSQPVAYEDYDFDAGTGFNYFEATELIDGADLTGLFVVSGNGASFKDCIIHGIVAGPDAAFTIGETNYIAKATTFEHCTFYWDSSTPDINSQINGCTFIKCDLAQAEQEMYEYLIDMGMNAEASYNYIVTIKRADNIFTDCNLLEQP